MKIRWLVRWKGESLLLPLAVTCLEGAAAVPDKKKDDEQEAREVEEGCLFGGKARR